MAKGSVRAFGVLLGVWLLFALIYWKAADESWWQPKQPAVTPSTKSDATIATPINLTASDALLYSAGVMALQKPEPAPANKRAKFFVLLETIFGPVQAALLALAIRRKFMRLTQYLSSVFPRRVGRQHTVHDQSL